MPRAERVLRLESGEGLALVSLDTGAVVTVAGGGASAAGEAPWRILDRSPISARIVAGTGNDSVELRYELDGRRLWCERRTAGGGREVRSLDVPGGAATGGA